MTLSGLELASFCLFERLPSYPHDCIIVLEYVAVTCCYKFDANQICFYPPLTLIFFLFL